jgi:YHS domain-containing protein
MKRILLRLLPLAGVFLLAGGTASPQLPSPAPEAATKTPATALCAVCSLREKAGPEAVAASYVYQGTTYYFCKQQCKEEFRLDPEKWIQAAAAPEAAPKPLAPKSASAVPT